MQRPSQANKQSEVPNVLRHLFNSSPPRSRNIAMTRPLSSWTHSRKSLGSSVLHRPRGIPISCCRRCETSAIFAQRASSQINNGSRSNTNNRSGDQGYEQKYMNLAQIEQDTSMHSNCHCRQASIARKRKHLRSRWSSLQKVYHKQKIFHDRSSKFQRRRRGRDLIVSFRHLS